MKAEGRGERSTLNFQRPTFNEERAGEPLESWTLNDAQNALFREPLRMLTDPSSIRMRNKRYLKRAGCAKDAQRMRKRSICFHAGPRIPSRC